MQNIFTTLPEDFFKPLWKQALEESKCIAARQILLAYQEGQRKRLSQNKKIEYFDGGFYIYEHLVEKTKIPFSLFQMDVITLEKNKEFWKELSKNDCKRLKLLQVRLSGRKLETVWRI